jgi:tetratricopeptide (TPR) repeat protein
VSTAEAVRNSNGGDLTTSREGFIDLASLKEDNPVKFSTAAEDKTLAASRADGRDRDVARLDLARFYLANQFGYEAIGVLRMMQGELKSDDLKSDAQLLLAAADVASGRPADALPILNAETFADEVDAQVWRAVAKTDSGDFKGARVDVLAAEPVIATYPKWVRLKFALSGVRAAVETGDTALGERLLKGIDFADLDSEQVTLYQLLSGRLAEAEGRASEALDTYGQVIAADIRPTRAEAIFRTILILDQSGRVDPAKATRTLAAEALLWRGNALESQMDALLAELYFRSGDYRSAFETVKQTVEFFPASPAMDALSAKAQDEFEALYLNGKADQLPPVEALSLYYDFRTLTPPGARGDEMIRNLAARLVKVDLLSQAADLLRYQIENRLKGAAQAEIATELAVIEIANRKPEDALRVLTSTELADLPPSLERQRRILQARALIDSNRNDLALDLLTSITGRDADLLRVEANWNSKYFEDAGNLLEVMYSPGDGNSSGPELTQAGRMNLVRAGVAFALANDRIGLSRLRSKFGEVMGKAAEWPMFDYVTAQIEPVSSPEFKKVARAVSGIDTLDAFLASYRQTYGGSDGIAPASAGAADGSAAAAATPPTAPVPAG